MWGGPDDYKDRRLSVWAKTNRVLWPLRTFRQVAEGLLLSVKRLRIKV